jgi:hypothetical protein
MRIAGHLSMPLLEIGDPGISSWELESVLPGAVAAVRVSTACSRNAQHNR